MTIVETIPFWQLEFDRELATARAARERGNEGMCRVCARRAAGIVAAEFFRRQHHPIETSSAYDRLKILQSWSELSPETAEITGHFLLRLTPELKLPLQVDLIAEAIWLREKLLENQ